MALLLSQLFYVDDLICGAQDEEQGLCIYEKSKQLKASGGFNLSKRSKALTAKKMILQIPASF